MSLFDKDLVEKEIPLYSNNTILGDDLTYVGVIPEGIDKTKLIEIERHFFLDPTIGSLYIENF